jgi:hypothetical protein
MTMKKSWKNSELNRENMEKFCGFSPHQSHSQAQKHRVNADNFE